MVFRESVEEDSFHLPLRFSKPKAPPKERAKLRARRKAAQVEVDPIIPPQADENEEIELQIELSESERVETSPHGSRELLVGPALP